MSETKSFYQESVEKLKSSLRFSYSIMDELFTFAGNKQNRYYVWTVMVYTQTRKSFYYYRLCPCQTTEELFEFDLDLPRVNYVFCDEAFTYDKMYADKAIQVKGTMTSII